MSNLLKDASILLTPTAYENGRMNAIKPYKDLYGSELVTNGDFSNGSTDWTISGSASVGVNKLNVNAGAFDFFATQTALTNGLKYKVTLDAEVTSGDILLYTGTQFASINSSGSYTFYTTSDSAQIRFRSSGSGFVGSITNVSVKEDLSGDFQFSRNSAATRVNAQGLVENVQIISDELVSNGNFSQIGTEEVSNGNFSQEGSELVTNGDFATDSDWNKDTSWTIENGAANYDGLNSVNDLQQTNVLIGNSGTSYVIRFEVKSGTLRLLFAEGAIGLNSYANYGVGTHTIYVKKTTSSTELRIYAQNTDGGTSGSIDNVSVKEVGQDWTVGTGWSIRDGLATHAGTFGQVTQDIVLDTSATYKIELDLVVNAGAFFLDLGSASYVKSYNSSQSVVFYHTPTGSNNKLYLTAQAGFDGSITNISVKEVGQDWTFGSGWSVDQANSKAISDGTTSNLQQFSVDTSVVGKKYKISLSVSDYLSGFLSLSVGGYDYASPTISSNGDYTRILEVTNSSSNDRLYIGSSSFDGSVSNVSVKEITDDTDLPRINYEGFSYQDSLGSEEVVNGDFATDSNWNKDDSWTISGGTANYNYISGRNMNSASAALVVGKTYKLVYTILNYSSGYVINDSAETRPQRNSNGTYTEVFTARYTFFRLRGSVSGEFSIDNVSVKEVIGQEVVPDSGCGSWLLEPQSTNLITYSEDFSQWSIVDNASVNGNQTTSPDGKQNAYILNSSNASSRVQVNMSVSNAVYNQSIYLKYAGDDVSVRIRRNQSNDRFQLIVNSSGITIDGAANEVADYNIEDVGNGWYRVSNTQNNIDWYQIWIDVSGNGGSVYAWGAQLEQQSYATSYIPTNGATNTRLQDVATNSGNSTLINSTEGVLYAEIAAFENDTSNRDIYLSDKTANNRIRLRFDSSNNINALLYNGNIQFNTNHSLTDATSFNKIAFKYKANDLALWINGVEVHSVTSATVCSGLNDLSFLATYVSDNNFFGKNKALAVYKEALTDANLRCLTYPNPVATTFDLDFNTIAEQFTFTRGSEATFVNEQGLIQSTNQIGPELITNGDFATDSNWNKNNGATISGGKGNIIGDGSSFTNLTQGNVFTVGKSYKVTVDVTINSGLGLKFQDGTSNENFGFALTTGSYTFYGVANNSSLVIGRRTGGTAFDSSIDNISVKEVISATNTPRIDYSTGEKAFLLEPQSTNTVLNSNSVTTFNYGGGITASNNAAISPDNTFNAMSLIPTTISGIHRSGYNTTAGLYNQNDIVTLSCFVKSNGYNFVRVGGFFGGEAAIFNVSNGTLVSQEGNVIRTKIIKLTNDWYRLSVTYTFQNSINNGYLYAGIQVMNTETGYVFTGDGISGLYAYGTQTELGTGTSYIPTDGAAATRNQEVCVDATPVINSEEGTLYAEIAALADDGSNRILRISDGGGNTNAVEFRYAPDGYLYYDIWVGGNSQFSGYYTSFTQSDVNKIAIKYKENDFALWVNGTEIATDTSGVTFSNNTLDNLSFSRGSQFPFFGNTKGLKYYPKALADVQLEDLTTI